MVVVFFGNHDYQSYSTQEKSFSQGLGPPERKKKRETRNVVTEKRETILSRPLGELDAKNEMAVTD